jgi:hypoxanthine-guanine phosphoribosyltransferase
VSSVLDADIDAVIVTADQISAKISELAKQIDQDYRPRRCGGVLRVR